MALIPLEGVQSVRNHVFEAVFNIKVHSQVALYKFIEFLHYLIRILFHKSLQFANAFEFVEVLFELSVKIGEDVQILLEHLDLLVLTLLSCHGCCLLKLTKSLSQSEIEGGHLILNVTDNALLLLCNHVLNVRVELYLLLVHQVIQMIKHFVHLLWELLQICLCFLLSLLYFLLVVGLILFESANLVQAPAYHVLLHLVSIKSIGVHSELLSDGCHLLIIKGFGLFLLHLVLGLLHKFRNALLAKRRLYIHDWFWEMYRTNVLLKLSSEWLLHHLRHECRARPSLNHLSLRWHL